MPTIYLITCENSVLNFSIQYSSIDHTFNHTGNLCLFNNIYVCTAGQADYTRRYSQIVSVIIIIMGFLQIAFEVCQFCLQRWRYLCDYTNYIDWILLICTCIFAISVRSDVCVCPRSWQWQVGSIAVFLSWIDLLIILRMLPLGMHCGFFLCILNRKRGSNYSYSLLILWG